MDGEANESTGEVAPEADAIDRFERMVDTQVATLERTDDKAAHVIRFASVLVTAVFAGLSLVPRFDGVSLTFDSIALVGTFGIGVLGLLGSLGFAIVTALSSAFEYGPNENLGEYLARHHVPSEQYENVVLQSYSTAIRKNRTVVRTNARRFRNSLAFLLVGIVSFALGGTFVVTNSGFFVETGLFIGTALVTGRLFVFVLTEEYLTFDYQICNYG